MERGTQRTHQGQDLTMPVPRAQQKNHISESNDRIRRMVIMRSKNSTEQKQGGVESSAHLPLRTRDWSSNLARAQQLLPNSAATTAGLQTPFGSPSHPIHPRRNRCTQPVYPGVVQQNNVTQEAQVQMPIRLLRGVEPSDLQPTSQQPANLLINEIRGKFDQSDIYGEQHHRQRLLHEQTRRNDGDWASKRKITCDPSPAAIGGTNEPSLCGTVERNEKDERRQRLQHDSRKQTNYLPELGEQEMHNSKRRVVLESNRSGHMGATDESDKLMTKQGEVSQHQPHSKKAKLDLLGRGTGLNTTGRAELKKQSVAYVITTCATMLAKIDAPAEDERRPSLRNGVESDTKASEAGTTRPFQAGTTPRPPSAGSPSETAEDPPRTDSDVSLEVSTVQRLGRHSTTEATAAPLVLEPDSVTACAAGLNPPPIRSLAPPTGTDDELKLRTGGANGFWEVDDKAVKKAIETETPQEESARKKASNGTSPAEDQLAWKFADLDRAQPPFFAGIARHGSGSKRITDEGRSRTESAPTRRETVKKQQSESDTLGARPSASAFTEMGMGKHDNGSVREVEPDNSVREATPQTQLEKEIDQLLCETAAAKIANNRWNLGLESSPRVSAETAALGTSGGKGEQEIQRLLEISASAGRHHDGSFKAPKKEKQPPVAGDQEDQTIRDALVATLDKQPVQHLQPPLAAGKAEKCEQEVAAKQVNVQEVGNHERQQQVETRGREKKAQAHDPTPPSDPDRHQEFATGLHGGLTEQQRQIVLAHENELMREIIEVRRRRQASRVFLPLPAGAHNARPPPDPARCGRDARAAAYFNVSEQEERRRKTLGLEDQQLMRRLPLPNEEWRGSDNHSVERQTILVSEVPRPDTVHAALWQDRLAVLEVQPCPQPSSYQEAFLQTRHSNELLLIELSELRKSRENESSSSVGTSSRMEAVAVENTQMENRISVFEQKIARLREALKEETQRTSDAYKQFAEESLGPEIDGTRDAFNRNLACVPSWALDHVHTLDLVIREGDSMEAQLSKRKNVELSVRLEQAGKERDTLVVAYKDMEKKIALLEGEVHRRRAKCKTYEAESTASNSDLQESKQSCGRLEAGLKSSTNTHERLRARFQVVEATSCVLRKQAKQRGIVPQGML